MNAPDRAALLAWPASAGLADAVLDDERLPDDPIILRQWSDGLCVAEGITDPDQQEKRWKTVQRWPKVYPDHFPEPAILRPRRLGSGRPPAVYSRARLDAWRSEHGPRAQDTDPARLARLASLTEPMTLYQVAKELGLAPDTVYKARAASLERLASGRPGQFEIPDPESGGHDEYRARYNPARFAVFWASRPGRSRRT